MIRALIAALLAALQSGPKPAPAGIPTPGPLPVQVPTPIGKDAVLPPLNGRILKSGLVNDAWVKALQKRLVEIGYHDLNVDGDFGEVTVVAVRRFQSARNLDPDGEVGSGTWAQLARADAAQVLPPLLPPSTAKYGEAPAWYQFAAAEIGFHEKGVNQGLEHLIAEAGFGKNGDAWCSLFIGAKVKKAGYPNTMNAMARSFEHDKNFVKLSGPALGCIVTMWRISPTNGQGHVFFYDGESASGVRGIGGNETDQVKRSFHERRRVVGYYWPATAPMPARIGPIPVNGATDPINTKET